MSHMPEAAYASAAAAAAPDTYATSRQHRASGGAPTTNGQHDGSANGASANDFRNAYSQDGFGGGGGSGGGAGGAGHWSQPSPYGSAYPANQFAAQNGSSHPSYPSSTASPYGASSMGGHQMHAAPYSAFSMQGQHGGAGGHHRGPAGHSMHINSQAYHHDSGPATPNGAGGLSQHATPGAGGLSGSPAYHSPSIAGMVPGVAHHHGAGAHQGYPSHYSQSMMGQPAAALQAGAINSPGYPSVPQYSTQLPLAGRHRVTTTLWEDEGTLCFQVDAKGVCVARRHDNSMINGTKLLNVCGMSRGKRDGILKNEKERIVVKVGAMHLKGVWITFQRGKQLAEQNGISELLYPLFEPNIQSFLYHPDNYPRTAAVMAAAQERQNRKIPDTNSPAGLPGAGGATSHDQSYDSWAAQRHQLNGAGGASGGYISAPVTATQSPSHAGAHSGYSTPAMPGQQPSTPSANGVQGSGAGAGQGGVRTQAPPNDRRHSMPLNGQNPQDHPGRAENPYAMPSIDSMQSHSNPASALQSLSAQGGGPGTAGGAPQQRRTMSGTKRGYEDQGSNDDAYTTGVPASASSGSGDRMYKRLREGRDDLGGSAGAGAGGVGNESYGDGGAGLDAHAYGNGRADRGPVGKVRSHVEGVWRN